MKLVIKGAYYYDRVSKTILMPHYTGEFSVVDCNRFVRMSKLKNRDDDAYIDSVKHNPIIFEDKKYYNVKYSPQQVGDWELLSDLSELEYSEEAFDW